MTLEAIATPAATAVLVAAVVALARKDLQWLDGWRVLALSFGLAQALSVGYAVATDPKTWFVGVINGLLAFVAASGGTSWAQQLARPKE